MRSALVLAASVALAASTAGCRSRRAPADDTTGSSGSAASAGSATDLVGWRADLAFLAAELPKRHPAPFHQTTEAAFDAAIDELATALPGLSDDQRLVGLARIVALVADGHTQLDLGRYGRKLVYPLTFYWFPDGVFVIDAAEPYRWAIGARVITVGERSIDEATAALSSTVGWQADGFRRAQVAWRLAWPQFVRGTGLAPADGPARYGVVDASGATRELIVEPMVWRIKPPAPDTVPLYRQRPSAFYWSRYLPTERALYVQYNTCYEANDLSFAAFTDAVTRTLDSEPVDRLIVDLRWNGGGNSEIINPLLAAITARPTLRGRVFALIGRHTFSSALMNAIDLDQVGALLVGEPAGSPAAHYGEVDHVDLPARGLSLHYSTRRFEAPGYPGPALAPEVAVELSSADYLAGRDPVLAAALARPVPFGP